MTLFEDEVCRCALQHHSTICAGVGVLIRFCNITLNEVIEAFSLVLAMSGGGREAAR